ncbi:MAG: DUF4097 family beta strand repeat protein [Lachnospiraceae bacterium]|nr:DUF4097 family beta strand repeat protein [Lachnospiraceae bacterium]
MRKWLIWNLIGVIFCVIGAVIIVKTLFQAGFNMENFSTAQYVTNTCDVEEAFVSLSVKGDMEDVILVTSEDEKCHLTFREEEKARHQVNVENDTLIITVADDRPWYEKIGFWAENPMVTIALPKAEYGTIKIENNVGDVQITDVKSQNLYIKGNTGDVELTGVIAGEEIKIDLNTGDVNFKECDGKAIYVETVTGDVTGSFLSGKRFEVETNTGDAEVPDSSEGGTCRVKTNTGDVKLEIK